MTLVAAVAVAVEEDEMSDEEQGIEPVVVWR